MADVADAPRGPTRRRRDTPCAPPPSGTPCATVPERSRRARPSARRARRRRRHRWLRRPARRARPPRHRRRPEPRRARLARAPGRRAPASPTGSRRPGRRRDSLAGRRRPGRVDLVCCHGILEVVDDPDATLARRRRGAAPGGYAQPAGRPAPRRRAGPGPVRPLRPGPHALDDPDGRWGTGRPAAAPVRRRPARRAGRATPGCTVRGRPRRAHLRRPGARPLDRRRGRPHRPARARAGRRRPPGLASSASSAPQLHVLARRA